MDVYTFNSIQVIQSAIGYAHSGHTCTHTHTFTRSLKETGQERMNEKVVFQTPQTCIVYNGKIMKSFASWCGFKATCYTQAHTHTERINDALSFIKQNRFDFVDWNSLTSIECAYLPFIAPRNEDDTRSMQASLHCYCYHACGCIHPSIDKDVRSWCFYYQHLFPFGV